LERFFGLLLENYKGELPFWLSPEQIRLVTVSDKFNQFALELQGKLCQKFRVSIDASAERLSAKIRDAELERVPAIITIGKKEIEERVFPVRLRQTSELKFIKEDELISYFSSFLHN
jgi:threonyl-tRNA synthetase